jgi:hypothetical protein
MEVSNIFDGGMKTDYSHSNQPQRTYTYCLNGVNISDNGDIFSLSNEKGTTNRVTNFPTGFKIIGGVVLNTDLIICLANPTGPYSQIGIVDSNFSYTRVAPNSNTNNDLGFSITKQIDCVARKLFTGERILYYTDNNQPIGYLNLDNPPTSLSGNISIFPEVTLPIIDFSGFSEDGGNLHCGVYQFLARYKTKELNSTSFGFVCNPIPVVDENRSVGRNLYDGGYPDYPSTVQKSIKLNISNIDTDYPFLEIIAIKFDGQSNEFKAFAQPLISISGNSNINYVYTGDEGSSTSLTKDEVTKLIVTYNTAKCIEQKDGRLIFSNLGYSNERYDLQSIANNIVVKYTIEEIEYIDGLIGPTSLSFGLLRQPYFTTEGGYIIKVKFTDQVDSSTGITLTNYQINYDPTNPSAYASGPDYILGDKVNTSNKIYTCIQASGSGTNAPTGTTSNNTWWQYNSPYIINPTSAVLDTSDQSIVILTMDITDTSQIIQDGFLLTVQNVKNFAISSTITTTTQSIVYRSDSDTTVNASFNDYKDEDNTFRLKGYQREEIYSLGMGVEYLDGSRSLIAHIPGSDFSTSTTTTANSTTKVLGTYVSTATYPSGLGYPTTTGNTVRHHKMPTLIQEPHYRVDGTTGRTYIRILGLDFTNVILPTNLQAIIRRVFFVRQSRIPSSNRSILAQGLVNNLFRTANDFDSNTGAVKPDSRVYKKVPFFNNFSISQTQVSTATGLKDSAKYEFSSPNTDVAAFFSPDSILVEKDLNEFAKIKNVLTLTGGITRNFIPSDNSNNASSGSYSLRRPLQGWLFGNYNNTETPGSQTVLDVQQKKYIQSSDSNIQQEFFTDYPIDNSISGKFLCIKTSASIPNGNPNTLNLNIQNNLHTDFLQIGAKTFPNFDSLSGSDIIKNYLFNIYKNNIQQYGSLDNSEYIIIAASSNLSITDYNSVFGGDTFITKFAFANKDNYNYRSLYYNKVSANYIGSPGNFVPRFDGYDFKGLDLRTLSYFFVESTINSEYRHQYTNGITSGVKYFPKSNYYDTLLEDPRNGDATSYNTQYSFENTVQSFFGKSVTFVNVTRYETRSIYSEEAKQDDTIDNYRVFLPNNYYDLPKHTGPIWDTFVNNNTLYLHTPKGLWRTYFNDVAQQVNDIGETVLGTGGVFTLPSTQVVTSDGGYAGTISQFGGVHTPYGYIFPDALQGKVFLLNEGLSEISLGMSRYFANNLGTDLVSSGNYIDNPSNPSSYGIIGVYDFDRKRYVLTKHGTTPFTISCSLLNPSEPTWISYHSYTPHLYFSIDKKMLGFDNTSTVILHEHNIGNYGVYYGNSVQSFIVEFIINNDPNIEKVYDNLFIYSEAYNNGNFLELETFKSIQCKSTKKDTGVVTLTCTNLFNDTSNVKKKRDRFQVQIPRNSLGSSNMFRDRMKGEWMNVKLSYPNSNNYKLLVNFINSEIRPVSR